MFSKAEVEIQNSLGLHARPSSKFVRTAQKYQSRISVKKGGSIVDGKSVMGLMTLAAARGSRIIIEAEGQDAEEMIEALKQLIIIEKFGEE